VKTEAWVVYPWEMKEFTYDLATQLSNEGKPTTDIESQLLTVGVPIHYAQLFLKQWLETEAKKVPA
jgi:hypothetical protein